MLDAKSPESESAPKDDARVPPSGGVETASPVSVTLGCTYCRGWLVREDAVYCAACLAPCHVDCFRAHGRCPAPGCGEKTIVKPRGASGVRVLPVAVLVLASLLVVSFGLASKRVVTDERRVASAPEEIQKPRDGSAAISTQGAPSAGRYEARLLKRCVVDFKSPDEVPRDREYGAFVTALRASQDGARVHAATPRGLLVTFDIATGRQIRAVAAPKLRGPVAFSPDGAFALVAAEPGRAVLYDLQTGAERDKLRCGDSPLSAFAFSRDGTQALSAGKDGEIAFWDLPQCLARARLSVREREPGLIPAQLIDRQKALDGLRAAMECIRKGSPLWKQKKAELDEEQRQFDEHRGEVERQGHVTDAVAFTPDGKRFVTGGARISVWDLESGRCLSTLGYGGRTSLALAVLPDGQRVLSGSYDGALTLWDLESRPAISYGEHAAGVQAVAVSDDGKYALSVALDSSVRVVDLESRHESCALALGEGVRAWSVAFVGRSHSFAIGTADGQVLVFELVAR